MDKTDPSVIKHRLINLGLKCSDVKIVTKARENNNEQVIFIVYFERKSITLKELRQNYSVIEYIKVRWEYQKPNKSKLTQCYNCQMFGHGSNRCNVKTFCAHCAGEHNTKDCKASFEKCANCSGAHKSMSPNCPSRETYVKTKQRALPKNLRERSLPFNNNANYNNNFPNSLNQSESRKVHNLDYNQSNFRNGNKNSNNLFSFEEMKNLTFELISSLQNCKSREEQFEVITNLACKFLYS